MFSTHYEKLILLQPFHNTNKRMKAPVCLYEQFQLIVNLQNNLFYRLYLIIHLGSSDRGNGVYLLFFAGVKSACTCKKSAFPERYRSRSSVSAEGHWQRREGW